MERQLLEFAEGEKNYGERIKLMCLMKWNMVPNAGS